MEGGEGRAWNLVLPLRGRGGGVGERLRPRRGEVSRQGPPHITHIHTYAPPAPPTPTHACSPYIHTYAHRIYMYACLRYMYACLHIRK